MIPLTAGNARVKEARKLSRRSVRSERRLFLADGPNAVREAMTVPGCVVEVFATPEAALSYDGDVTLVDERALASLSESVTPAGVVAVCRFLDTSWSAFVETTPGPRLVVVCAEVRDPGNAGTVIRTADAAGADAVVLAGTSVDPYNAKTVRATAGSLFHVPIIVEADTAALVTAARQAGLVVLAADGAGEMALDRSEDLLSGPTAWLFGNESRGLPGDLADLADHRVRVPIHGRAESLNLSTAAAVCLYASAGAHRRSSP